jgi:hypothetical protein
MICGFAAHAATEVRLYIWETPPITLGVNTNLPAFKVAV